jgi:tRNA pseudouridine55 synthase
VNGFLIVDKPSGVTSFSMVSLVRRLTGVRRVGHAGTLDPLASGVLPVAVGQATRFIEYMDDALKTYHGAVRLGEATDTYDAAGVVTAGSDASGVTAAAIEQALAEFVGEIEQTPPVYSAIKVAGKPLYRYAREGADVAPAPRRVHVERAMLLGFGDGVAEIEVRCGKGTYIRSIAHDLGRRLGCGAHLAGLRRTSSGGFGLDEARTRDELSALAGEGRLKEAMLAPDRAVERRPAVIFEGEHTADVWSGRDVALAVSRPVELCRAYSAEGDFLGVLRRRGAGVWHPEKVLARAETAESRLIR